MADLDEVYDYLAYDGLGFTSSERVTRSGRTAHVFKARGDRRTYRVRAAVELHTEAHAPAHLIVRSDNGGGQVHLCRSIAAAMRRADSIENDARLWRTDQAFDSELNHARNCHAHREAQEAERTRRLAQEQYA